LLGDFDGDNGDETMAVKFPSLLAALPPHDGEDDNDDGSGE
jgi:hypothetical protein